MGKIPDEHECPIDVILCKLGHKLAPTFKKLNFTPNCITTLSLIFGILSAIALWKGYVWLFAILYFISYFFDCMDGLYARKYKMTSKFGDWYDHIKDGVVITILLVVIYYRYRNRCSSGTAVVLVTLLIVMSVLTLAFVGCQAKTSAKSGDSMNLHTKLCVGDPYKNLKWIRYMGTGVWTLVFIVTIIAMETQLCPAK